MTKLSDFHKSVLLSEAIEFLRIQPDKKYIDATLGGGGHSFEILKRGGIVLGLDVDQEAIEYVADKLKVQSSKFKIDKEKIELVKGNFRDIDEFAHGVGFEPVAGILFDLGVSGYQFDTAERGFSFAKDAPLDMRMDKELQVMARDLLRVLTKGELYALFTKFGEESNARKIASYIVESRRIKPIETTGELEDLVRKILPRQNHKINPATRIFQALRIAVNDELGNLTKALPKALKLLEPNGRMVVLSFHSLEDKIVKHIFADWEKNGDGHRVTKKPLTPSDEEKNFNPRSRSAKMRVFEKR